MQRRLLGQERYLGGVGLASECYWTSWVLEERSGRWTSVWMGQKARAAEGLEWETGPGCFVLTPFMVYKEI